MRPIITTLAFIALVGWVSLHLTIASDCAGDTRCALIDEAGAPGE